MPDEEWAEIESRFDRLSFDDKIRLIERLLGRLRRGAFIDTVKFERGVAEMAADPDVQRELGPASGR